MELNLVAATFAIASLLLVLATFVWVKPTTTSSSEVLLRGIDSQLAPKRTIELSDTVRVSVAETESDVLVSYVVAVRRRSEALQQFRHDYDFAAPLIEDEAAAIDESLGIELATLRHAASLSQYREAIT